MESLMLSGQEITDLRGIEHAINLTNLNLRNNQIQNIRPLAKMPNLRVLNIDNNAITSIKPLSTIDTLREITLIKNPIRDPRELYKLLKKNPHLRHDIWHLLSSNVKKIAGPWTWTIVPTNPGKGGANSISVDCLANFTNGVVTENAVATKGAKRGDIVGDHTWIQSTISTDNDDNINELVNRNNFVHYKSKRSRAKTRYNNDHSSYALITLVSKKKQTGVRMFTGSDDAIKVWLNGKVVFKNVVNRGADNFQESFKVDLKAGNNLLLVKVSQNGA